MLTGGGEAVADLVFVCVAVVVDIVAVVVVDVDVGSGSWKNAESSKKMINHL